MPAIWNPSPPARRPGCASWVVCVCVREVCARLAPSQRFAAQATLQGSLGRHGSLSVRSDWARPPRRAQGHVDAMLGEAVTSYQAWLSSSPGPFAVPPPQRTEMQSMHAMQCHCCSRASRPILHSCVPLFSGPAKLQLHPSAQHERGLAPNSEAESRAHKVQKHNHHTRSSRARPSGRPLLAGLEAAATEAKCAGGRRRRLSLAAGMVWHTKHPADATGPHRAWALAAQSPANQRAPPTQSGREGRFAGSAALVRGFASRPRRLCWCQLHGESEDVATIQLAAPWLASQSPPSFREARFFSAVGRPRQLIWEGGAGLWLGLGCSTRMRSPSAELTIGARLSTGACARYGFPRSIL